MVSGRRPVQLVRIALGLAVGLVLLYALDAIHRLGPLHHFAFDVAYDAAIVLGALVCVARGLIGEEPRRPWLWLGLGLLSWTAGELLFDYAYGSNPPVPSWADAGYLLFYPAAYAALVGLVRPRLGARSGALLLDGLVGGLTVGALAAALVVAEVAGGLGGGGLGDLITLAYPLGDVLLLGLVTAMIGLTGWRPGRTLVLVLTGFAVLGAADAVYAYLEAGSGYTSGLLDVLWPAGILVLAWAAWRPPGPAVRPAPVEGWRLIAVPAFFDLVAVAVLVLDHFHRIGGLAVLLAAGALVAAILRLGLTFAERGALLARTRTESLTDALTSLPNRRRLAADLEAALAGGRPHLLLLFDLDGFKPYNDSFGHPAGDALLVRLGRQLAEACAPEGTAYRMGGDEFCALLALDVARDAEALVDAAADALQAWGEAFHVTASWGGVLLPVEAATASEALGCADRRMYAHKHARRPSPGRQSTDVLLRVLEERHPELGVHGRTVAHLAAAVAVQLGLEDDEAEDVRFAAELHDVGKVAVPDAILAKPGPLDDEEWAFIRRHTVIGERIVAAAPALEHVAALVRASHERWDGSGYPDGRRGEEIPLGARIVTVCDAWEAITAGRPYCPARSREDAAAELRRCAGAQFDPAVVEAFLAIEAAVVAPVGG